MGHLAKGTQGAGHPGTSAKNFSHYAGQMVWDILLGAFVEKENLGLTLRSCHAVQEDPAQF